MKPLIGWKPVTTDRRVASARLRCFLPMDCLNAAGWNCELFDERRIDRYELVIFQKVYDDASFLVAEKLKRLGAKTLLDLCDNHFYIHAEKPALRERAERLQRMVDMVDFMSVSTMELKKLFPERQVTVIDDAVEWPRETARLKSYSRWKKLSSRRLRIVWYGHAGEDNPPFGLIDLPKILPALENLNSRLPLTLTVISNSEEAAKRYVQGVSFPFEYREWKERSFAYVFRSQDVCVIPVTLNPFTVCKTSNRLVLSLLHHVPVVADRVPSYEEFRSFVLFDQWERSIYTYATDKELRNRHIRDGVEYIRKNYGPERVLRQWSSLFNAVLG